MGLREKRDRGRGVKGAKNNYEKKNQGCVRGRSLEARDRYVCGERAEV